MADVRTVTTSGAAGEVAVEICDMPVDTDARGLRFPYTDFGADLIDVLYRNLRQPSSSRLPWRTTRCGVCRSTLPDLERNSRVFDVQFDLGRIPAFSIRMRLPSIRCPSCGSEMAILTRSEQSDLSDALIDAFKAAGVRRR